MIRSLNEAEAEDVAALIRAAFGAIAPPPEPAPSALRVTGEAIRAHLAAGGGGALYGADGCVLWDERDGGLYVGRLAVRPEAQGRGIARALLARAEAEARARGLGRMHLGVRLALAGNRRLFRRFGFVEGALHSHEGFAEPTWVEAEKILSGLEVG